MRAGRILIVLAATAAIAAPAASAAPSDLDTSFGKGGKSYQPNVLAGLGEDDVYFASLRVLPDGRIVALGQERCAMSCRNNVVARYTPAGRPDATFGTPSRTRGTPAIPGVGVFPGENSSADDYSRYFRGLAIADDGGVVLGYAEEPGGPSLVRRGPHGAVASVLAQPASTTPLAVLPDGRILAFRDGRAVLLRSDGTPDPALGGDEGGVPVPLTGSVIGSVIDGVAVVAGTDSDGIVLARIPLDGSPVVRGHIPLRRPEEPPFTSLVPIELGIDASGGVKVLVSAYRESGLHAGSRRVIGAFTPLGKVDARFGGDGVLGIAGSRIAVQRNGKVVIVAPHARKVGDNEQPLIGVRRLDARGRSDRTFTARRLRTVAKDIVGLDVDLDRRGRIVIGAGAFTTYGSSGVLLVRLRGGEAPRPTPR
jgi:hypothetical protein